MATTIVKRHATIGRCKRVERWRGRSGDGHVHVDLSFAEKGCKGEVCGRLTLRGLAWLFDVHGHAVCRSQLYLLLSPSSNGGNPNGIQTVQRRSIRLVAFDELQMRGRRHPFDSNGGKHPSKHERKSVYNQADHDACHPCMDASVPARTSREARFILAPSKPPGSFSPALLHASHGRLHHARTAMRSCLSIPFLPPRPFTSVASLATVPSS